MSKATNGLQTAKFKLKKGDAVIVISGKDKGKKGKVILALPRDNRVVVEGINIRKHHERARKNGQKGQIVEKAVPLHVSNVMLIDSKSGKGTRIGQKIENGKKIRIGKKSGNQI